MCELLLLLLPSIRGIITPLPKSKRPPVHLARRSGSALAAARAEGVLLNVGALAPYAVERGASSRLSRVRSRLGSAGPGHPLGSLDLSGQRHVVVRTPRLTRMSVRIVRLGINPARRVQKRA